MIVNVTNSSGDDFYYMKEGIASYYAPYPFNVGIYESESNSTEFMIVSKKLKKGQSIAVLPIAKMNLNEPLDPGKEVIIATPFDTDLRIFDGQSFQDFTVNQFSLKQLIELWYSNRYDLQGTTMEGWTPVTLEYFKPS